MAIAYPAVNPPLVPQNKSQTSTFGRAQPLEGPAYLRTLSNDAPAFYNITFRFGKTEAMIFYSWVVSNGIFRGAAFDCPIGTPFNNQFGSIQTQEVELVDGDLRTWVNNGQWYDFTGTFRTRKEVTGLEDDYEFISQLDCSTIKEASIFDEAINLDLPDT